MDGAKKTIEAQKNSLLKSERERLKIQSKHNTIIKSLNSSNESLRSSKVSTGNIAEDSAIVQSNVNENVKLSTTNPKQTEVIAKLKKEIKSYQERENEVNEVKNNVLKYILLN